MCITCNNIHLVNRPTTSLCYIHLKLFFIVKIQNSNKQSQQRCDCKSYRESRHLYEEEKCNIHVVNALSFHRALVFAPIGIEGSSPKPSKFSDVLQRVRAIGYKFLHLCISSGPSVCHTILQSVFSLRGQLNRSIHIAMDLRMIRFFFVIHHQL